MSEPKPHIVNIGNITIHQDKVTDKTFIMDDYGKEIELTRSKFGDLEELLMDFLNGEK